MTAFFEFSTPRQILGKAIRDLQKLEEELTIDNVFNFFVTAYHVVDYVRTMEAAPDDAIRDLYEEPDFRMCRYICNKGKHLALRGGDEFSTYYRPGSALGEFVIGESALGLGPAYLVIDDTDQVDVIDLGQRIIRRWESFFEEHGI
jgi:hypothetical protein